MKTAVKAYVWNKNGDHPHDYAKPENGLEKGIPQTYSGEYRRNKGWSGGVVKRFRSPDPQYAGGNICPQCGISYHHHGLIEATALSQALIKSNFTSQMVCPGSMIVTRANDTYVAYHPDSFNKLFNNIGDPVADVILNTEAETRVNDPVLWGYRNQEAPGKVKTTTEAAVAWGYGCYDQVAYSLPQALEMAALYHTQREEGASAIGNQEGVVQPQTEVHPLEKMKIDGSFGQALEALKDGRRVARDGWNGKGMWVYLVTPDNGVQPHMLIKGADGKTSVWVPSSNDALATDWYALDPKSEGLEGLLARWKELLKGHPMTEVNTLWLDEPTALSPERAVFHIDLGNMDQQAASQALADNIKVLKGRPADLTPDNPIRAVFAFDFGEVGKLLDQAGLTQPTDKL